MHVWPHPPLELTHSSTSALREHVRKLLTSTINTHTTARYSVHKKLVSQVTLTAEPPREVNASVLTGVSGTLVSVETAPAIFGQVVPLIARALVTPKEVGTGVGTVSIRAETLVDICRNEGEQLVRSTYQNGEIICTHSTMMGGEPGWLFKFKVQSHCMLTCWHCFPKRTNCWINGLHIRSGPGRPIGAFIAHAR